MINKLQDKGKNYREASGLFNKLLVLVRHVPGAFVALSIAIVSTILLVVRVNGIPWYAYALVSFFYLLAVYVIIDGIVLLRARALPTTQSDPFRGSQVLKTVTEQPHPRVTIGRNSIFSAWLGPVDRTSRVFNSVSLFGKEHVGSPENTIFLCEDKLIFLAVSQADFDEITRNNVINVVEQLAATDSSGFKQKQNLLLLHMKRWPELIDQIKQKNFYEFCESHYNFELVSSDVSSVIEKKSFFNGGIVFTLSNGSKLRYSVIHKEAIGEFLSMLSSAGFRVL